ncbi:putative purine nucleoside permease [Macrophomina phaseolina]|uniref:Purine nucleoside permease n=1 Tax=Macrophomina phaseolina TaxID=35725 RepID=A0ABQ8FY92_9PEZI|nr:putative purine nucleoside permease [Macrophomina phaseolina]
MRLSTISTAVAAAFSSFSSASPAADRPSAAAIAARASKIKPKVFIVSMFDPEAEVWWGIPEFDLLAKNVSVPGFSPLFPEAHCTSDGQVCQLVTGEGEINAAVTLTALYTSGLFDLSETYFLVAGIAGISPEVGTLGSVTFARFAVQVALQYEFDYREVPQNWSTGYIPQGSYLPDEYPGELYGTEVFEVNTALRDLAMSFASTAALNDSEAAVAYRANYGAGLYAAGTQPPSVIACDTATSDVYWSGRLLGEAFANFTDVVTNGTGVYCTTQQEDNATLESLMRGAKAGVLDFSRIVIMRTASDFDRPYPGQAPLDNLLYADQGGFDPSIQNIYLAGVKVVEGILGGWNGTFKAGVKAENYVGDIFGTLGGEPDFGPGSDFDNGYTKRSVQGKTAQRKKKSVPRRRLALALRH